MHTLGSTWPIVALLLAALSPVSAEAATMASEHIVSAPAARCTDRGTDGRDRLAGTRGDDVLCGGRSGDILLGRGGDDVLRGGAGRDLLKGGGGDDVIDGRERPAKRDRIYCGAGHDVVRPGPRDVVDISCEEVVRPEPEVQPVAVVDRVTVAEDSGSTVIDVLANDTGPGLLTVQSVTQPDHGVATSSDTQVSYSPDPDACGPDLFTYTITGGSEGTVILDVQCVDDPPEAVDDTAVGQENGPEVLVFVVANDTDRDGGPIKVVSVTSPAHGTSAVDGEQLVTYLPAQEFCGSDEFEYTLEGGSTATVHVEVECMARFTSLAVGAQYVCGLTDVGEALCKGDNQYGRLGDGTTTRRAHPTAVDAPEGVRFTQLAADDVHTCGLSSTGIVYCWGDNSWGQVGDGTTTGRLSPTAAARPEGVTFTQIAVGDHHTCALAASGAAYCWGENLNGQVGDGTFTDRTVPTRVLVPEDLGFVELSTGGSHTCGIADTGQVHCWGYNDDGRLGDGTNVDQPVPVVARTPARATLAHVTVGRLHSCAMSAGGKAWCWGANLNGELGDGTTTYRSSPSAVIPVEGVDLTSITAGDGHTCALAASGQPFCWGSNSREQVGDGTVIDRLSPTLSNRYPGVTFTDIDATGMRTCGLSDTARTYCWRSPFWA